MNKFAEVLDDETLFLMDSPMEIIGHFTPGNYTPTAAQATCLITSAVESVIQWYKLQREWNEQDGHVVHVTQEQMDYLQKRLKEKNVIQSSKEIQG